MSIAFGWWDHFEFRDELSLNQQYKERIEMVQLAEALGFTGYHVAEHHFSELDLAPSPLMFLAALARETSTIRLGTMVLCLPLYHPSRLLQELCMVDQFSDGRLDPGVGRGLRDIDHIWLGSDPMDAVARYRETLDVLQQGVQTGRLNHKGKYFEYDDVPVRFEAQQKPLRFWAAGSYKTAAENAMSCIGSGIRAEIEEYWSIFESRKRAGDPRYGGPAPRVGSNRYVFLAPDEEQAKAIARRAWSSLGRHFWSTSLQVGGFVPPKETVKGYGGEDADEMMASGVLLAGTPETVGAQLEQLLRTAGPGYNYMMNAFQWGDLNKAEASTSMTLFSENVMPRIRRVHGELAQHTAA